MQFSDLGLNTSILRAVEEEGYKDPTPIQVEAIPSIICGNDTLAIAQTGTGKTAAFVLPLLHYLDNNVLALKKYQIPVLIMVPTRELALQVDESIRSYSKYLSLKSSVVIGGVGINPQLATIRKGVDILIATPGRLIDIIDKEGIDLSALRALVLDEADRMLDMGFIKEIQRVISLMPKEKQTLLFSATFLKEIKSLASSLLHEPKIIEVSPQNSTVESVSQRVYLVERSRKRELLAQLIKSKEWKQVLVFVATKHGANRLCKQLEEFSGLEATAIHGNKSQGARTKALEAFKEGKVRVLVATDIAARGLDIDQLPYVVNYELPSQPQDYVHRIGRTGRAGMKGEALTLLCKEEEELLKNIENFIGKEIQKVELEAYKPKQALTSKKSTKRRKKSTDDLAAEIGSNLQAKLDKFDQRAKSKSRRKK